MAHDLSDDDLDALAEQVAKRLPTGSYGDRVVLSRRQLVGVATGTLGAGALVSLGIDPAVATDGTQDTSDGQVQGNGGGVDVRLDELRDRGGDEILDVDDAGAINAQYGREWRFDSVSTDKIPNSYVFADAYTTLQDAQDAVSDDGASPPTAEESLVIPPGLGEISETLDITKVGLKAELPGGTYPHISGSGDHTLHIQEQDVTIDGGWVDQVGTGSFDAVFADASEVVVRDVDIDDAPRYGYHCDAPRCESSIQVVTDAGDTAAAYTNGARGTHDWIIQAVPGDGAVIDGALNRIDTTIRSAGGRGCVINGVGNVVRMAEFNSTGNALEIDGSENVVTGRIDGDVLFTSNSSNNRLSGVVNGSITDNGTNNDTSDVS